MKNDEIPARNISSTGQSSREIHAAFQHLVSEIFRLNGQLLASADKLARELDLTPARWQAIAVVQREPVTVSEISRRLGIKRQSVQPTVNRLRDQGIVQLKNNPDHRRAPLVELTPLGREMWGQLLTRQQQLTTAFTGSLKLTARDLERVTTELRAMRRHAQNND